MSASDTVRNVLENATKMAARKMPSVREQYLWIMRQRQQRCFDDGISEVEMMNVVSIFVAGMAFKDGCSVKEGSHKIHLEEARAKFIELVSRDDCL